MNFHDVRFPAALSMGSTGGPERRTDIVELANGFEARNAPWAHARRRYDAGLGLRDRDDLHSVLSFFEARMGRLYAFRWRDWADHRSCAPSQAPQADDCEIGRGDGATRSFQLSKTYEAGPHAYRRPICKPVEGSVQVAVDGEALAPGAGFAVDHLTGAVTLGFAPHVGAVVSAGFLFDVPARFDTDRIEISIAAFDAGAIPSIPVIEVRL